MNRRVFVRTGAALVGAGLALTVPLGAVRDAIANESNDSKRRGIDAKVHGTLAKMYENGKGPRELVDKATGLLVFPAVIKVGFVAGGEYGEGALRVGGKSVGYYNTVSGSFGL